MTATVLFAALPALWEEYAAPLPEAIAAAGAKARIVLDAEDPAAVDYIVYAPTGGLADFAPFTGCKAVLSLWAGVERIVGNPTLTQPLARMVDPGLTEGMVEYVTGHVLRHHLGMDDQILRQDGVWRNHTAPPLARDRRVAMLGLGALGLGGAEALVALNFSVLGWSRSPKSVPGIDCHSGEAGLAHVLSEASIVVTLLPLTEDTRDLMSAERLALMPPGAVIINPGRGPLIDDAALLAALDAGRLGHATLDVFRVEPLPADHPFWAHPRVTVTPHVAADTRPGSASKVIAENIRRGEAGLPFLHLVGRDRGY